VSKLVLSGDTSGSVTLDAPAVSGTTILTLPTTSGTLVVTSGSQTIEFADGSASTPSITNSGDTNTGMFFPAADTIAFAEGGAEAMRLTDTGLLQFNSGYGSVATAYGCRAWVNFNGTSTVAIRGSGNVTSITDNGTGDYTVNITTAMPDVNYSAVTSAQISAASTGRNYVGSTEIINSSSIRIRTIAGDGVFYDYFQVFCSVFR
jgi:hypothetical protein